MLFWSPFDKVHDETITTVQVDFQKGREIIIVPWQRQFVAGEPIKASVLVKAGREPVELARVSVTLWGLMFYRWTCPDGMDIQRQWDIILGVSKLLDKNVTIGSYKCYEVTFNVDWGLPPSHQWQNNENVYLEVCYAMMAGASLASTSGNCLMAWKFLDIINNISLPEYYRECFDCEEWKIYPKLNKACYAPGDTIMVDLRLDGPDNSVIVVNCDLLMEIRYDWRDDKPMVETEYLGDRTTVTWGEEANQPIIVSFSYNLPSSSLPSSTSAPAKISYWIRVEIDTVPRETIIPIIVKPITIPRPGIVNPGPSAEYLPLLLEPIYIVPKQLYVCRGDALEYTVILNTVDQTVNVSIVCYQNGIERLRTNTRCITIPGDGAVHEFTLSAPTALDWPLSDEDVGGCHTRWYIEVEVTGDDKSPKLKAKEMFFYLKPSRKRATPVEAYVIMDDNFILEDSTPTCCNFQ